MRCKRDIKLGWLCTPGGVVVGIVDRGVTFRFLNGEAILDDNMLFWVRLYALVVVLKILLDFYNGENHMGFVKKSVAFGVPPAYNR